jgi:hypothetical protein
MFHLLMLCELGLPSKLHAPSQSTDSTLSSPAEYEMAFEFGEATQDRDHQLAVRGGSVCPAIAQ